MEKSIHGKINLHIYLRMCILMQESLLLDS